MTETLSARLKYLSELRKEAALEKLRKAQEDVKSRQSQTEPNNVLVVQEQNPNEAHGSLVKDVSATHYRENNGSKSANGSENMTNDCDDLTGKFAKVKLGPTEKTPEEIWKELTTNPKNLKDLKLDRYRSLDVTPDPSWFESILSKLDSVLEKTADRAQLKGGNEDLPIERRNDILKILMQGALELGSYILDSPEVAGKLAAQRDVRNEDPRNVVTSIGTATDNLTEENAIFESTLCDNCPRAPAPYRAVKVLEETTQDSRERSIYLYYTIDLYKRVHSFHLEKYEVKSCKKTVACLYVPIKSPPPTRRPANFDASKARVINAISGWVPVSLTTRCPDPFIQNNIWTKRVMEMCKTIGYELQRSQNDQGNPGKYNACHAEKQIIAYWIHNYIAKLPSRSQITNWAKKCELPIRPEYYEGLFIVVSNPLCDCCERFLNHVAIYYTISFTVYCQDDAVKSLQRDD
ncbi:hypothetical protein BPAE_0031g00160 [Botrytis paeoniae]|uniref:Single-strand DNA deaminase toxin A-like C-terminal domain-containing protein n=1 Tax=Botrytis paeoniae TaxID=278948 RepID=A0A4Z1G2B7_9HELO|nr:hypothetical protein BPAE_0031g00160 [Botrytis paeoniae]